MPTETELREWRHGQVSAERLCAGILHVEDYSEIQPQAPLGGPDGRKDILATREGELWVAAVFFPPTGQTPAQIASKFAEDSEGVETNDARGFVFLVNQQMTLTQRRELAESRDFRVEIYHVERIRSLLDAPRGYGLRLEFLGIEMSREEQVAFFSDLHQELTQRLLANERGVAEMSQKIDLILQRTTALVGNFDQRPSSLAREVDLVGDVDAPMANLSVETLSLIHRIAMEGEAPDRGSLRSIQVVVGDPENPFFTPAPPDEVPARTAHVVRWWRAAYPGLRDADRQAVVDALARLHHDLVSVHPFVDGNGRVARIVIDQAARELLHARVGTELVREPRAYFESLRAADSGDLSKLSDLVAAALT